MCVCVGGGGGTGEWGGGGGGGVGVEEGRLQKPEHFHFFPSKMLSNTIFLINDQTPFYFFPSHLKPIFFLA